MTMYMTPFRRRYLRHLNQSDRVARNLGSVHNDVHIPLDVKDEKDAFVLYAVVPGLNAEDIEIEITTDEGTETVTQAAVAGTDYIIYLASVNATSTLNFAANTTNFSNYSAFLLESNIVKVRVRKTTAAGANTTYCRVFYGVA